MRHYEHNHLLVLHSSTLYHIKFSVNAFLSLLTANIIHCILIFLIFFAIKSKKFKMIYTFVIDDDLCAVWGNGSRSTKKNRNFRESALQRTCISYDFLILFYAMILCRCGKIAAK